LLGILAGFGTVVMSAGLLNGGMNDTLTDLGGPGYRVILPIWAFALSRVFRSRAATGEAGAASATAGPAPA
jgi:hypothetical protein